MKKSIILIIVIQAILLGSCEKDDKNYMLDDFIEAGSKTSEAISYYDFNPDINCKVPFDETESNIYLDLNKDGIDDFVFNLESTTSKVLEQYKFSITPLQNNEICINPATNWLDTIPYLDAISMERTWSNNNALVYSYYNSIDYQSGKINRSIKGHWKDVITKDKYFVGYKIKSGDKTFYGWLGMMRAESHHYFSTLLTDYAILKEYEIDE